MAQPNPDNRFDFAWTDDSLPAASRQKPHFFEVDRIIVTRGGASSPERVRLIEEVAALYPEAEIIELPDTPHNRVPLDQADPVKKAALGKRTLVFGKHKSAVRFSEESGNSCPNYWHFSPWGFCFYGCKYCYLSGTPTVWHSPTIKIFVNLEEIVNQIDKAARRLTRPTAFYLGKLQDGLALDPLTGYSRVLVPFFAGHEFARMTLLTKSDQVDQLLDLDHQNHTVLSWSVNPPAIAARFEENVPAVEDRLRAMQRCADCGYPVRAVMMPLIPVPGWQEHYAGFTRDLLEQVPLQRLTLGGICIYKNARTLMETKLGKENPISRSIDERESLADGRARYSPKLRAEMYGLIIKTARAIRPDLELALCLEDASMWKQLGLAENIGRCNCVW